MDRTSILLPPELRNRADRRAQQLGISFGALVRRALVEHLDAVEEPGSADAFFADRAVFSGDASPDAARRHDAHLDEKGAGVIFVDTGPFLARYLERDQHHAVAVEGFQQLERDRLPISTTTHVLDEALTLLGRWAGHSFAADRARAIYASRAVRIVRPNEDDEVKALAVFERYADQHITFTDALSIAVMDARRMREAFSFDRSFQLAGFGLWPDGVV